jgi:hypothetical protein
VPGKERRRPGAFAGVVATIVAAKISHDLVEILFDDIEDPTMLLSR